MGQKVGLRPDELAHTVPLLPGSVTAVYCSSWYFSNAGSSDCSRLACPPASVRMSARAY